MTIAALRLSIVTTLLGVTCSCVSTGTVSDRAFFYEKRSSVWQAAIRAMHDVGAKIVASNEAGGMLSGQLNAVELGGRVRIDVIVRSSGGGSELENTGTDLSVSVVLEGVSNDDPVLRENLSAIRDAYIDAARYHAGAAQSRVRR